jgi:hypothetical protein
MTLTSLCIICCFSVAFAGFNSMVSIISSSFTTDMIEVRLGQLINFTSAVSLIVQARTPPMVSAKVEILICPDDNK